MTRRLLWALNHRTLMPDEVGLLRGLGWAVYTPRVLPRGEQSTKVEDWPDETLGVPDEALAVLNAHPFYERNWSPTLAYVINRFFDVVVSAYYPSCYVSAVRLFRGMVIGRVFGRESVRSYSELAASWGVPGLEEAEAAMGDRLVFGPSADGIADNEPPAVAARAVTLPLPPPGWALRAAGTWTGEERRLQFLCPLIATHPYYGALYRTIKANFGDLPHVIFGKQSAPVEDPCVLPMLSEDDLLDLYARSRAFLYLSREPRHLHYSPLEAMVVGAPVLYLRGSRLDIEAGTDLPGACGDLAEMRAKARDLLDDGGSLAREVRDGQKLILSRYSAEAARDAWRSVLDRVPRREAA